MHGATSDRRNNFDAIRLAAALTVLVGHSWSLTGRDDVPQLAGVLIVDVAIWVFFSLSGYLVATSWARDSHPGRFLARRAARIFPALVVVVVATTFLVGPAVTTESSSASFRSAETWVYLTNITLVASYELPGVFDDAARPVVNGSLWTIGPEFLCYLVVMALGLAMARVGGNRPKARAAAFAGLGTALALAWILLPTQLGSWEPAVQAAVFFMVGAALASLPDELRLSPLLAAVGVGAWIVAGSFAPPVAAVMAWGVVPSAVLAVGRLSTPGVRAAGRWGDVSYGTYLWGFVIQQVVAVSLPEIPLVSYLLLTIPAVLLIAYCSWHFVEKPVLTRVRQRLGQRGNGLTTERSAHVSSSVPAARATAAL